MKELWEHRNTHAHRKQALVCSNLAQGIDTLTNQLMLKEFGCDSNSFCRETYCQWITQANADKHKLYTLLPAHQHRPPSSVQLRLHRFFVCVYITWFFIRYHTADWMTSFQACGGILPDRGMSPQKHPNFPVVLCFIDDKLEHQTFQIQLHDPLGLSINVIPW